MATNFGAINATVPKFLNVVDFAHRLVGPKPLSYISSVLNKASGNYIPQWNPYMPSVRPLDSNRSTFNRGGSIAFPLQSKNV